MTDALKMQHGGAHYKGRAIQPVEFAMANGYDCCIFSSIKYVTRHDVKGGAVDLDKGEHFVFLRLATMDSRATVKCRISPIFYCRENKLGETETNIILALHDWAAGLSSPRGYFFSGTDLLDDVAVAKTISNMFSSLRARAYPTTQVGPHE
jgi:hypothetical protein